jgi:hypothetical protein
MPTGYSDTPLAQKLGLKPGIRAWFHDMPASVRAEIEPEALLVEELAAATAGIQAAHIFVTRRETLEHKLDALCPLIDRNGFIWVSWPKKASKVETDITEDVIRDVALPKGLVDIKVCAVDDVWSGLKLVIRKENR